jgi:multimeric flavodoxin WrbA/putative sterol carrier protein
MLRKHKAASQLNLALLSFTLLGVAAFWLWPQGLGQLFATYPAPLLYAVFTTVVAVPLFTGSEPFTTFFAKRITPESFGRTEQFKTINRHMTAVWSLLFTLCGLASLVPFLIYPNIHDVWVKLAIDIVPPLLFLLLVGKPFNKWYPNYYMQKQGIRLTDHPPAQALAETASNSSHIIREDIEMTQKPNIVAIIGTPHQAIGNTSQMVEMMRPTLEAQGFALEIIHLATHQIEYCTGCGWCLEKGRCWIPDDHHKIMQKVLAADGLILGSPVYFFSVTAQMKTFIDRSLAFGHKPRGTWKPGVTVSVSAGFGETEVANYLSGIMRAYGAYAVGSLTALAVSPGAFMGQELVETRAKDLAGDMIRSIKEKRRYPATETDLRYWQFMGGLVTGQKDGVMADDYKHWQKNGLFDSFEAYMGQETTQVSSGDPGMRQEWIKQMIADYKSGKKLQARPLGDGPEARDHERPGPQSASSLLELLQLMPQGLNKEAAAGIEATYQFEVSGDENFTAHLVVADQKADFREGSADNPGVVIKTPADVWLAVSRGEMDGQAAFMGGKYTTEGDFGLLMKLGQLFRN